MGATDILSAAENGSRVLAARTRRESQIVGRRETPRSVALHEKAELPGMIVAVVSEDVENGQRERRMTILRIPRDRLHERDQLTVVERRKAEIGIKQAACRMYMASSRAIAVETAGREVKLSSIARQQWEAARRFGHERVRLFHMGDVLGIVATRELHQPWNVSLRGVSLDGAPFFVDGDQSLGTGTARGSARPAEFGNHVLYRAFQNAAGTVRQPVEIHVASGFVPWIDLRRINQRAHSPLAYAGETVQRRQRDRIDTDLACAPIKQQSPPTVRQAVIENSVQPLEDFCVVGRMKARFDFVTHGRQFEAGPQKRVVVAMPRDRATPAVQRVVRREVPNAAIHEEEFPARPSRYVPPFGFLWRRQNLFESFEFPLLQKVLERSFFPQRDNQTDERDQRDPSRAFEFLQRSQRDARTSGKSFLGKALVETPLPQLRRETAGDFLGRRKNKRYHDSP